MNKRDLLMQQQLPTIMMPKYEPLAPATEAGERIIVASNGIFLEVTRVWARLVRRIGEALPTPVPYGECHPCTEWKIDDLPIALLAQFDRMACATPDTEIGACIIWNEKEGYRLSGGQVLTASKSHIQYEPPPMADGEHLIVDCHSHAHWPAHFSSDDNEDDRWDVKLAYVVGHCDIPQQSKVMRFCIKGIFEKAKLEVA